MLAEEGAEIADILDAAAEGHFADRHGGGAQELLGLGKPCHEDIFRCLVSCYGLDLSVELGPAYAHG